MCLPGLKKEPPQLCWEGSHARHSLGEGPGMLLLNPGTQAASSSLSSSPDVVSPHLPGETKVRGAELADPHVFVSSAATAKHHRQGAEQQNLTSQPQRLEGQGPGVGKVGLLWAWPAWALRSCPASHAFLRGTFQQLFLPKPLPCSTTSGGQSSVLRCRPVCTQAHTPMCTHTHSHNVPESDLLATPLVSPSPLQPLPKQDRKSVV